MMKYMFKTINILTAVLFLTICWNVLSSADEWDRMHIQEFKPRRDPPKISLKSFDGEKVTLEDFKGKVIFLNFWATWCGWCKKEMPSMERLYEALRDQGLVILAVDVRESVEKIKPFWDRYGLTFTPILDPSGMASLAFGVRGMPATFIIDRQGKVVGSAPGYRDWFTEDAQKIFTGLLSEEGPEVRAKDAKAEGNSDTAAIQGEVKENATFDLNSISGPPIHSQGRKTLKGSQIFDLDKGIVGTEGTADLSWSELGLTTRFLIPQNGAEFSNKGIIEKVTFDDIIMAEYSVSPINGSEGEKNRLKPGTVLYARTNEGRFACLRVDNNASDLELSWVTYEKD
jgi:thiol-disulfide isomerase/thioredoxin